MKSVGGVQKLSAKYSVRVGVQASDIGRGSILACVAPLKCVSFPGNKEWIFSYSQLRELDKTTSGLRILPGEEYY